MTTKTLIISAVIASTAMTANAQGVIPTYTMATLPSGISDGLFRGGAVFADVNNDGKMDMVVKGRDLNDGWTPKVQLALGGALGFASGMMLSEKTNIYESCLNLFDFNNDGNVDILLSCYSTPFLFKGNGNGTFTKMIVMAFKTFSQRIKMVIRCSTKVTAMDRLSKWKNPIFMPYVVVQWP